MLKALSYPLPKTASLSSPKSPLLKVSDYAALIQHYARTKSLDEGKCLHRHLQRSSNPIDPFLANFLVLMYGNCGSVIDARSTFESIPQRNVFSWNMLVTAHARNGHLDEAEIILEKFPEHSPISFNSTIAAHATAGSIDRACNLFQRMPVADVVTWTAMISGYTIAGRHGESIQLFRKMCIDGVMPDRVAFISILEACDSIRKVESILSMICEAGFPLRSQIGNALITAYGRNARIDLAKRVFDAMDERESVSWNAMITASAKNGDISLARSLFERMPERDVISWTAFFAELAQIGELEEAREHFDRIPKRNDVCWNAMIAAYAQNGHGDRALEIFRAMDLDGVLPTKATFVSALDACTIATSSSKNARFLLAELPHLGFRGDIRLDTALMNLHSKVGSVESASAIFNTAVGKNEICWNSMIAAYATNGLVDEAIAAFHAMILDGFVPNQITFRIVLGALSHAGKMDPSWDLFLSCMRDFSTPPGLDHYLCIVDLLARVGRLCEAQELVARMPFEPDIVAWMTLLGACMIQRERDLGEYAATMLLALDSENDSPYIALSHLSEQD